MNTYFLYVDSTQCSLKEIDENEHGEQSMEGRKEK